MKASPAHSWSLRDQHVARTNAFRRWRSWDGFFQRIGAGEWLLLQRCSVAASNDCDGCVPVQSRNQLYFPARCILLNLVLAASSMYTTLRMQQSAQARVSTKARNSVCSRFLLSFLLQLDLSHPRALLKLWWLWWLWWLRRPNRCGDSGVG